MRCDHCGTPCTKRHPVVIDRAVAMVGSDCARKFPRARPRDLIRDLATYYKRYTLEREPPIETSGAFTNPWSLERFLSDYHGHGWERKKQSKKDNKIYGDRYAKRYGAITYELRIPWPAAQTTAREPAPTVQSNPENSPARAHAGHLEIRPRAAPVRRQDTKRPTGNVAREPAASRSGPTREAHFHGHRAGGASSLHPDRQLQ
jgi:hypothetical protein